MTNARVFCILLFDLILRVENMEENKNSVEKKKKKRRRVRYVPLRYVFAVLISVAEVAAIIGLVIWACLYVPHVFFIALFLDVACIITIIASNDNPEYKVPWLVVVLVFPIVGFMLYLMFYSRKLKRKFVKRLIKLADFKYPEYVDGRADRLKEENLTAYNQAELLRKLSGSALFSDTRQTYFSQGEEMWKSMLVDLENAQNFIYLEFFIIEQGEFWDSILDILKEKAKQGLDVRVLFDDIGCMRTLPGNYAKKLRKYGIKATQFSRLKGQADNEFNNRSHRKLMIVDGKICYTGGVNIADEYVNLKKRFGHWKDSGIRLEGEAVYEFTRMFLIDFGINVKKPPENPDAETLFPATDVSADGYVVPFGDGPKPFYKRRVAQSLIVDMLFNAKRYAYITTPYLIIDNDLCLALESAALKGVDVRIVVPHIPDKKIVFEMTKTFYERLMKAGVKIYEYKPGFIHAKSYLVDDETAMIGTVNMDYRSLVHHFENGVWMYKTDSIADLKNDMTETMEKSIYIQPETVKTGWLRKLFRSLVRFFAPLM